MRIFRNKKFQVITKVRLSKTSHGWSARVMDHFERIVETVYGKTRDAVKSEAAKKARMLRRRLRGASRKVKRGKKMFSKKSLDTSAVHRMAALNRYKKLEGDHEFNEYLEFDSADMEAVSL